MSEPRYSCCCSGRRGTFLCYIYSTVGSVYLQQWRKRTGMNSGKTILILTAQQPVIYVHELAVAKKLTIEIFV